MDSAGWLVVDDLFPACLPMHVDGGDRASRDELMALAHLHGLLHARAGLRRLADHLSGRATVRA